LLIICVLNVFVNWPRIWAKEEYEQKKFLKCSLSQKIITVLLSYVWRTSRSASGYYITHFMGGAMYWKIDKHGLDTVMERVGGSCTVLSACRSHLIENVTCHQLIYFTISVSRKTASDWLDHYRLATGITSPMKYKRKPRPHTTCSALSPPSNAPRFSALAGLPVGGSILKKSRAPSAPPQPISQ